MVRLQIGILFSKGFFSPSPSCGLSEALTRGMLRMSMVLWGSDVTAAGGTSASPWCQVVGAPLAAQGFNTTRFTGWQFLNAQISLDTALVPEICVEQVVVHVTKILQMAFKARVSWGNHSWKYLRIKPLLIFTWCSEFEINIESLNKVFPFAVKNSLLGEHIISFRSLLIMNLLF